MVQQFSSYINSLLKEIFWIVCFWRNVEGATQDCKLFILLDMQVILFSVKSMLMNYRTLGDGRVVGYKRNRCTAVIPESVEVLSELSIFPPSLQSESLPFLISAIHHYGDLFDKNHSRFGELKNKFELAN